MSARYQKCLVCNIGCPLSGVEGLVNRSKFSKDPEIVRTLQENARYIGNLEIIFIVDLMGNVTVTPILLS